MFLIVVGLTLVAAAAQAEDRVCPYPDPLNYTVHLPADKCTQFYKCEKGVPLLFECPDGLNFNAKLEVCDWPDMAGCIEN